MNFGSIAFCTAALKAGHEHPPSARGEPQAGIATGTRAGGESSVVNYMGFKTSEVPVHFEGADVKRVDIHLEVASQAESIVVTADRPHGEAGSNLLAHILASLEEAASGKPVAEQARFGQGRAMIGAHEFHAGTAVRCDFPRGDTPIGSRLARVFV